jgi:hypothetical protein
MGQLHLLGQPYTFLAQGRHGAHALQRRAGLRALAAGVSESDTQLAQKLGQLQPFVAAFPQECMGQLASFGSTVTPLSLEPRDRRRDDAGDGDAPDRGPAELRGARAAKPGQRRC